MDDLARELLGSGCLPQIAYIGLDGDPRSVPVWVELQGDELVLETEPDSYKARSRRASPR